MGGSASAAVRADGRARVHNEAADGADLAEPFVCSLLGRAGSFSPPTAGAAAYRLLPRGSTSSGSTKCSWGWSCTAIQSRMPSFRITFFV